MLHQRDEASSLKVAALAYAERGWPVFPCEVRGKRPKTRHGLQDATTDLECIERWWHDAPAANIGLRTGIAFDVLDLDGPEGVSALNKAMPLAVDPNDDPIVIGPTVETGKGIHVYLAPTGAGNRARLLPNTDWRGAGGYVIAPPSLHPNGSVYRWLYVDDPVYGPSAPLVAPPEWLMVLVTRRNAPQAAPAPLARDGRAGAYGRRALESECGRLALAPVGQRNDALNRSAFSLGQLIGAGELHADEAAAALLAIALRIGLSETEARRTLASGLRNGAAQPRRVA